MYGTVCVSVYVCFLQDDYRRAINEYDEKVFLSFKMVLRELRNIYVSYVEEDIVV